MASVIVGRALDLGRRPVFDDGDEVIEENGDGLPSSIMVGDHTGAFGEYKLPLDTFAAYYARPINSREKWVPAPQEFATAYLAAFREQFLHVQGDYRKRRRAFDTLFKHCQYDSAGSFAYRWECALLSSRRSANASPCSTPASRDPLAARLRVFRWAVLQALSIVLVVVLVLALDSPAYRFEDEDEGEHEHGKSHRKGLSPNWVGGE